jgi:O-antigen/teichoic acid export membrane protein
MKLSTKIAYNTIVQVAGKFAATALGLITIALITRSLGSFGYGQYTTIITFLSFFAIVAEMGLTLTTVKMISQPGVDQEQVLGSLFGLRIAISLLFIGVAPLTIYFFPYEHTIKAGVLIAALSFIFLSFNQITTGLFQKELRMDKASIADIMGKALLVILIYLCVKSNIGIYGILAATALSSAFCFIVSYLFSLQFSKIVPTFNFQQWKEILAKSWPLALCMAFNLLYLKTDTLLLSILERPSRIGIMNEVGLYGASYRIIDVLITFPYMFSGIVLPIMARQWHSGDQDGFARTTQKSLDLMVIAAVPMVIGTQFLAEKIMLLVAGRDFVDSGPILRYLVVAAGLIYIGNVFAHGAVAIDKQKEIVLAYFFTAITSVAGYLLFIPRYSYTGAALVTIYSEGAVALQLFYLVWRHTRFTPSLMMLSKTLLASVPMAVFLSFAGNTNLVVTILSAMAIYLCSLFVFKGISKDDFLVLLHR